MTVVLSIILEILKLLSVFVNLKIKMTAAEYAMETLRFKTLADIMFKALNKVQDSLNENAYLSNRDWEFTDRFNQYKKISNEILLGGGGWVELSTYKPMGFGIKIVPVKNSVIPELTSTKLPIDKAAFIAKAMVEHEFPSKKA